VRSVKELMNKLQMKLKGIEIRRCTDRCVDALMLFADNIAHHVPGRDYFMRQYESQLEDRRDIWIAWYEDQIVGYCIYNRKPLYAFFLKLGIPEIQDIIIHPEMRRQGIARELIALCEAQAKEEGAEHIGIGVGLDASYGRAQRLYVGLGYVPDGNGVTYERRTVNKGDLRRIDDDLSLMMVKTL
tara:strand:+ start:4264 stop:4818 length:555 start_codon:yes stop_codon:yes gene_type:complete